MTDGTYVMKENTFEQDNVIVFVYRKKVYNKDEIIEVRNKIKKKHTTYYSYETNLIYLDLEESIVCYFDNCHSYFKLLDFLHYNYERVIELQGELDYKFLVEKLSRNCVHYYNNIPNEICEKIDKKFKEFKE